MLDKEAYERRIVVERSFSIFKQWRRHATRYDKFALTYRGGVVLRAILIWLKELGNMPLGRCRSRMAGLEDRAFPAVTGRSRLPPASGHTSRLGSALQSPQLGEPGASALESNTRAEAFLIRPVEDRAATGNDHTGHASRRDGVKRPARSRGLPRPAGRETARRVQGPCVESVEDVRQGLPARRAGVRGG